MRMLCRSLLLPVVLLAAGPVAAQTEEEPDAEVPGDSPGPAIEMTAERLGRLIRIVDPDAQALSDTVWQFMVEGVQAIVISDPPADRMRIQVGIARAEEIDRALLYRLMQANFDSAVDARYALAQDILWGVYVHPLATLTDRQFLSGLGQTVNLARTFGTTFSSGAMIYGGGDSEGLVERLLIDRLLKKGTEI